MASANPLDYLYPLDLTGAAATNKVVNESRTLNPPEEELDFHFLLPWAGPYFRDTMVLRHITTNRLLIRGVDWAPGHKFNSASYELQNTKGGVYASILLFDRKLSGQVRMDSYQTLGGAWTLSENKILEIMSNKIADPRQVAFEEVNGLPEVFPPTEHTHPADDMTGFAELIAATYDVAAAIRARTQSWLDNPPLIPNLYYTKDEIDAKLLEIEGGGASVSDLEEMIDSMTASYTQAANELGAL